MLHKLLKSIYDSTIHKNEVEIHVIYDLDDTMTIGYIGGTYKNEYGETPPIVTFFHGRERSPNLIKDYHNLYATTVAQGKYIIFSNDDALFELVGWDDRAWNTLSKFEEVHPDGILYGMPEDFEHEPSRHENNWMACFPLISKKAVEVMGYAFDPIFTRDGADWALAATFYCISRVVDLRRDIVIKHLSYRSGRRAKDNIDEYAHALGLSVPSTEEVMNKNADILLKYIQEFNDNKSAEASRAGGG
jgi:hypothetical protein